MTKQKQTELKTLKDFDIDSIGSDTTEDLRREAVKWVKLLNEIDKIEEDYSDIFKPTKEEICGFGNIPDVIKFIKHFFNLTEEDLK